MYDFEKNLPCVAYAPVVHMPRQKRYLFCNALVNFRYCSKNLGLSVFCVTVVYNQPRIYFYFLVILLSPTYIGFNSNPTRTNGTASRLKNTNSQQNNQKLRKPR